MPQYQVYFDTREGERKYNVDFGEDEPIDDVLRDIVGELSEKGFMMRGLSTGDLKVIWGGGRDGRELDLSRTLPEQGVRPNDVLRVLVEVYEGGGSLRMDRIEKEWTLLNRLAALNPEKLEVLGRASGPDHSEFRVRLRDSPGVVSARGRRMDLRDTHTFRLVFPRFYPEMPIECYCEDPLFHPNVKQETGFVCLWEQANSRDTVIQAIARAQAMAAYRMVNTGAPHLMHTTAAEWYTTTALPEKLVPLTWEDLQVFEIDHGRMVWLEPGRTLIGRSASRIR